MDRDGAVVQWLQRQQFARWRGQQARHDQVVEDGLDVGAGDPRHQFLEADADLVARQVGGEIWLLFVKAQRHAGRGVTGLQAGHVQRQQRHAGRAQALKCGLGDGLHLRVQVLPEIAGQSQPQAGGVQRWQRPVVASQHGIQKRDVGHAVGDGPGRVAGMRNRRDARTVIAAHRRPKAHGAIERGRQANGGARVGAERGRHQARAHRRAAARGRAPGDAFGVIGVARTRAPRAGIGRVVAGHAERQFMHVGLADDDGAGFAQAPHDRGVLGRDEVTQGRGAGGVGQPRDVDVVLDRHGHAFQRPGGVSAGARGIGGPRLRQRAVRVHRDEGIEVLAGRDAVQAGPGEGFAGDLAIAKKRRGFGHGRAARGRLGSGHGGCLLRVDAVSSVRCRSVQGRP